MKKHNLYIPFASIALFAACLCAGCSEPSKVTGYSEEQNEIANGKSSSSSEPVAQSSSSVTESSSSEPSYSSAKVGENTVGDAISLTFYVAQFNVDSLHFTDGVIAAKSEKYQAPPQSSTEHGSQTASATEFNTPWPYPFDKKNIDVLRDLFPEAYLKYADLIDSIRNGAASDSCKLYMQNVTGDSKSVGFVLADITHDTITIFDIAAGRCKETTEGAMFRFLFRYCGEIDSRPEIVHQTVDIDIPAEKCPVQRKESEWISAPKLANEQ